MPDMKTIKTITLITTKKDFQGTRNIIECNCSELKDFYFQKEINSDKIGDENGKKLVAKIKDINRPLFDLISLTPEPDTLNRLLKLCKEENISIPEQLLRYTPRGRIKPFWVSGDRLFYIFHNVQNKDFTADKLTTHVNALVEFVKTEYKNEDIKVFLLLHRSDYLENKDDKALSYSYFMPGEKLDNELLTVRLFSHVDSPITQFIQSKIEGSIETIEDLCNRIKPEWILYRAINSYAEFRPYPDGSSSELLALNKILESQEMRDRAIKLIIEKNFSNSTPNNLKNILTELLKPKDESHSL